MGKFEVIRKRCLAQGTLYEDRDFPVTTASLFLDGPIENVVWKRPKEISSAPQFIQKEVAYHDMDQGQLGNCWFVASVACIAASPQKKLMERILPKDQGFGAEYCGAFRFFFWQYGKWEEVVIDDRLPTVNNQLIYGKNRQQPNEFWCPLMEKAFAKIYGSYHAVDGGFMDQCLVDLTGGIGDYVPLGNSVTTEELQELLVTCFHMNSVIGGVINAQNLRPNQREVLQDSGLYTGHAYTIIDVKEIKTTEGTVTLLHVRNPWGKGDWNGAWSDGSREWRKLSVKDREATTKYWNDGEFWMSVDDFRKHFTFVVMAHLTPDAYSEEIADNLKRTQWKRSEHYGSWIRGASAGGPLKSFTSKLFWKNPQFKLKLSQETKPTTCIIQLLEVNTPPIRTLGDVSIGFVVFKRQELEAVIERYYGLSQQKIQNVLLHHGLIAELKMKLKVTIFTIPIRMNHGKTRGEMGLRKGRQPHRITADNYYEFIPRMVNTSGAFTKHREVTGRFVMDPADHVIVPCTQMAGQQAQFYMRIFSEQQVNAEEFDGDSTVDKPDEEEKPDAILDREFDRLSGPTGGIDANDMQNLLEKVIGSGDRREKTYELETCRCLLSAADVYKESKLAKKSQVEKAVTNLKNLTRVFQLTDKDKTNFVEKPELRLLLKILEYDVSPDLLNRIMTRYGGRSQRLGLEDFVQICCKLLSFEKTYHSSDTRLNNWGGNQGELLMYSFI